MKKGCFVVGLALTGICVGTAHAASVLSQYHLIVSGALTGLPEVEGRAVINQVNLANSFNVGVNYSSPASQINLAIQGTVASGNAIQLTSGSIHVPSGAAQNGNQVTLSNGRPVNLSGGSLYQGATFDYSSVFSSLTTESAAYAAYAADSTLSLPSGGQPGAAVFNVGNPGADGVAVFNLSSTQAASLFNSSMVQQIELNLNGFNPSAILINVAGDSMTYNASGSMVGNFTGSAISKVLWNFPDATSLSINKSFYGVTLAPKATLNATAGAMEGAVGVKNLNSTVEVHAPLFAGSIPVSPVPEPSTWAAGFATLGLIAWQGWRRKRG